MGPELANELMFFKPIIAVGTTTAGPLIEIDIGAASADHGEWICVVACSVVELGFVLVSEAANGDTVDPTVVFTKRPTPLSATGETAVGTVTVEDGDAVGSSRFKLNTPVQFAVGDSMEVAHTVGTGSPAGQGFPYWLCQFCPEVHGNNSEKLVSAT